EVMDVVDGDAEMVDADLVVGLAQTSAPFQERQVVEAIRHRNVNIGRTANLLEPEAGGVEAGHLVRLVEEEGEIADTRAHGRSFRRWCSLVRHRTARARCVGLFGPCTR